jgi:hypothetical protein
MDSSAKLFELIKELLLQLPSTIVMVVCLVVALVRWRRHPRVSLFLLLSLTWLLLHGLVSSVMYIWVPDWFIRTAGSGNIEQLKQYLYLGLGLVTNFSLAIGLTLMLIAVFTQRTANLKTE